jgi:hypothetical protein
VACLGQTSGDSTIFISKVAASMVMIGGLGGRIWVVVLLLGVRCHDGHRENSIQLHI